MEFFSKHKIITGILALLLAGGILSPFVGDDSAPVEQPSAQTESISAAEEGPASAADEQKVAEKEEDPAKETSSAPNVSLDSIPAYSGSPYVAVNGNVPYFTADAYTTTAFENYSPLDSLGRCGVATACLGLETMPTEDRGSIGQVKPSGWHTVRYNGIVDGNYLYNRCHLIGYQLSAENANSQNLITGSRYLNVEGMLPFENMVADYIKETNNNVLYRVTPVFDGNNLVASGVLMEARSMEDNGDGISYCVFCYNVQPGIQIDYATGDSWEDGTVQADTSSSTSGSSPAGSSGESSAAAAAGAAATTTQQQTQQSTPVSGNYILNENTKKFHYPSCHSVDQMKNPVGFNGSRDDLIAQGYEPCKNCNP